MGLRFLFSVGIGVLLYHLGFFIEYKMGIGDTARVIPVHGVW